MTSGSSPAPSGRRTECDRIAQKAMPACDRSAKKSPCSNYPTPPRAWSDSLTGDAGIRSGGQSPPISGHRSFRDRKARKAMPACDRTADNIPRRPTRPWSDSPKGNAGIRSGGHTLRNPPLPYYCRSGSDRIARKAMPAGDRTTKITYLPRFCPGLEMMFQEWSPWVP